MQRLLRENERLKALLDFQTPPPLRPLAGRVWLRDAGQWFNSLLLRRGKADGVKVSDPVVTIQSGRPVLLGRVIETFDTTCRVLLVTDPVSSVSAELAPSGIQGAVEGLGRDGLVMNYLLLDSEVRLGDEVVTAGLGGGIPEGILLGYVRGVETDLRESFKRAFLKPAVELDRVREVFILRRPENPSTPRPAFPEGSR
jgi:rod shape-determining protein MreC